MSSDQPRRGHAIGGCPWLGLLVAVLPGLLACVGQVDPQEIPPRARAGCEAPTADDLIAEARMLPGRVCQTCHASGGEAEGLAWTASGTVYGGPDSPCNTGGLAGVLVELIDARNQVILSLTTNQAGNFFTSEDRDFSLVRARVSKDGKVREMQGLQRTTACAVCHAPAASPISAPGRIFLD